MIDLYLDGINGNDASSGLTEALAKKTHGAAWTLLAATLATAPADSVRLLIRGDGAEYTVATTSYLAATQNLPGASDRIIIQGYGETRPYYNARTPLADGWTDVRLGVIRRALPPGANIRSLWMANGTHLTRSQEGRFNPFYKVFSWDEDTNSLLISSALVPNVTDFSKLELVVVEGWSKSFLRVFGIADAGSGLHRVFIDEPPQFIEFTKGNYNQGSPGLGMPFAFGPYHAPGQHMWWEGAQEFCYGASTWTVEGGYIYVGLPPSMRNAADFMAAGGALIPNGLSTAFNLFGSSGAARVRNVHLDNVGFEGFDWNVPNAEGYVGYLSGAALVNNAGTYGFRNIPAAVETTWTSGLNVTRCHFRDIAGMGLRGTTPQHIAVENGNVFEYIGASAVCYGWGGSNFAAPANDDLNYQCWLRGNTFRNIGHTYCGSAAFVSAWLSLLCEHNSFEDCADDGLGIGTGALVNGNAYGDWTVRWNSFKRVMQVVVDGAAIYLTGNPCGTRVFGPSMQPFHRTARIYGNYFEDIRNSGNDPQGGEAACIYFDLGVQGALAYCNFAKRCDVFFVENCSPWNTCTSNRLEQVLHEHLTFYSGYNVEDGAGGYTFHAAPYSNPPTGTITGEARWKGIYNPVGNYSTGDVIAANTGGFWSGYQALRATVGDAPHASPADWVAFHPVGYDMDSFYGTGAYTGRSFKELVGGFALPEDVINTDGTYNSNSLVTGNGPTVPIDVSNAGVPRWSVAA